ncbi:uncharacterized protein LOC119412894 [Nematolebias whitei]|uniref:uncharacterized protein LOC119412894 n=1 Tax=Nematolebias whitei TaxID=451745 RepID=UPI00189B120C|nr:uncharacterized protein LOC119412894 [Nematolebias whitei]
MASANAGNEEGTGPAAESNEHDYAHAVDGTLTEPDPSFCSPLQSSAPPPQDLQLPEPTVCSEVEVLIEPEDPTPGAVSPLRGSRRPRAPAKRPEDWSCTCCRLLFQRQGRSFNRRAVYTFTTPDTVRWLFPSSDVNEKSFLCETCAQVVRSKGKRKLCGKRSMWLKPPTPKKVQEKLTQRMGKKSKAALLVSKSSYKAAFQTLWSSKGARKPMMEFWSKQLKNEMKALSRQPDNPFHQKVSGRKPLTYFPWRQCLNWAQEKAPLVVTCLRSMFPDINALYKSSHQLSEEQAVMLLERRTVVALSIPLFTRNIWRNNFLQAALGAELRQQGCSGSALDTLNTMGLCQNKDTVRLLLQRLRNGTDDGELMIKQDQMGEVITDEEEEEEDEEEEISALKEEDDEEEEILLGVDEEEMEQEEVQDRLQDEEDPALMEKEEKKRRKKKAKKQRKQEKRKARGKRRKMEEEEEEEDDDEDESEQKKKVVVVRLGLLKGTSEVGRSDLSAP